jgi:ABC-type phosphate transport system substrate-binding protein
MSRLTLTVGIVAALALASLGGRAGAAGDEILAVIVHVKNPQSSLSRDELEALFSMSRKRWAHGEAVVPINLEIGTLSRVLFDKVVLGMGPDEVARFWIDRRIRGLGSPPLKVPSPEVLRKAVAALAGAIGYVPVAQLGPGVKVVARVTRDQVIPEGQGATR